MIMKWSLCNDDHEVSQIDDGDEMIKKNFINDNSVMMIM